MLSEREVSAAVGGTAYGSDGGKLGMVEHFFVDDRTGVPTWVAISTGLLGTRHSVVPAADATFTDGRLRLPVTAEAVKNAPAMSGDHLDPDDEEALRRHYGLTTGDTATEQVPTADRTTDDSTTDDGVTDAPTAGRHADGTAERPAATDGTMTRTEEQLRATTERVATTRARLVKYVVTEDVQITVPIRREEIRVEHVPLDAPDEGPGESLVPADADSGTTGTAGLPAEIVLHTERPVVTVEVVPVERVRLRVDVVEGQETVSGQVQREQIVVDESPSPGINPR
jgi:stress response protein YsnF